MLFFIDCVINWHLAKIMSDYKLTNVELAEKMGVAANSISRMKNQSRMPRLSVDQIKKLLDAINELVLEQELKRGYDLESIRFIQPTDLMTFDYTFQVPTSFPKTNPS